MRTVQDQLSIKMNPLLSRFSQVRTRIEIENKVAIEVYSKDGFKNLPLLDSSATTTATGVFIRSNASVAAGSFRPVQDWNLFRIIPKEATSRGRTFDLMAHVGDWKSQNSAHVAVQALNILSAIAIVPYLDRLIVDIPLFQSPSQQSRHKEFETLRKLKNDGASDLEILHALNLPDIKLLSEYLPVKLVDANLMIPDFDEKSTWRETENENYYVDAFFKVDGARELRADPYMTGTR
ncbi:MAG: hypothetical protein ACXVA9_09050 [Bdellovibrionales bacterium]